MWSSSVPGGIVFLLSATLALLLTKLQIRFNDVLRLTAAPRSDRWHKSATPSSGGIAIIFAAGIVYTMALRGDHLAIALGALALATLGLIDDRIRLTPRIKLTVQCIVSACVVSSGAVFHATAYEPITIVFSFVWLVGITNAFNLIDNMDGLCAGVAVIIATFRYFLLATTGDWRDANLCALLGGAYAGFLVCNYRPARIFMGDCGSMLAGFSLAALTIATPIPHTKVFVAGLVYLVLTFTYPIFDTVLVSVLRKLAHRPISVGGKDHSSHRLVSLGLAETRVVWMLWGLTALGCSIGLIVERLPIVLIASGVILCGLLAVLGSLLAGVTNNVTDERCKSPEPSVR